MAWLIVSNDNETGPAVRADSAVMDAHWQYELANRDVILCAGSLRTDDGLTKTGSVLLLDLPTRADAEAFFANDPATKAGMRGETEIRWLNVAILGGEEQP
ncbi:MAG: YciI family protein [Roseovarius sp.]